MTAAPARKTDPEVAESPMKAILLPTMSDVCALESGARPHNMLEREFESKAELDAYRDGLDAIEDEESDVERLAVHDRTVKLCIDGEHSTRTFDSPAAARAYAQGVEDAEGFRAPLLITEDDPRFQNVQSFVAASQSTSRPGRNG